MNKSLRIHARLASRPLLGSVLTFVGLALSIITAHGQAVGPDARAVVDLSKAVIVAPASHSVFAKASDMLAVEIEKRSGIRLQCVSTPPQDAKAVILLGTVDTSAGSGATPPPGIAVPEKAEGYAIWVDAPPSKAPVVHLVGRDFRGALFAAGRLLRLIDCAGGRVTISTGARLATAPKFAIRGHQIGYRNTPNAYDAWDQKVYEQYFRDLIFFGTNSIEFTTTLTDDEKGPHMIMSTWDMTAELSKILDAYDLNCWIWQEIPPEDDVSKPEVADRELDDLRKLFDSLKRLDAVFVPGGDGGITPAPVLMPFLERLAPVLKKSHPKATLWVSNQTFGQGENDYFFDFLQKQQPAWLDGVVYGPWTKVSIEEMRKRTPEKYPMRLYADITHNVRTQYPVPDWDRAFAQVLNREAPNPRPQDMAHIFTRYAALAGDSITYSEGVNDDLNKFIWSALGWDPADSLESIVRDYGKVFFGDSEADAVAKGLHMLEENWRGPIANNAGIEKTLAHWKGIEERSAKRAVNWRLQMYLIRAYDDAYTKKKADAEAAYEAEAHEALKQAKQIGAEQAIEKARAALAKIDTNPPAPEYRKRIGELAADLFKSIGMQLSVRPPYKARGLERCALLDTLDLPQNNRAWMETQFKEILSTADQAKRAAGIDFVLNWENPGPGGFYDDLGNPAKQPHLVKQHVWTDDPGYVDAPQCEYLFALDDRIKGLSDFRQSWLDQASTIYRCPLRMHYDGLDPKGTYRLRVTYTGRFRAIMRLIANGKDQIHDWMPQPKECAPIEFKLPAGETANGTLDLEWQVDPSKDKEFSHTPLNRGCQVAEVWLIKE